MKVYIREYTNFIKTILANLCTYFEGVINFEKNHFDLADVYLIGRKIQRCFAKIASKIFQKKGIK